MYSNTISVVLFAAMVSGCSGELRAPIVNRRSDTATAGTSGVQGTPGTVTRNPDSAPLASASVEAQKYFTGTTLATVPATLWRLPATDIAEVYEWLFGAGAAMTRDLDVDFESRGILRGRESLLVPLAQNWYAKYLDVSKSNSELAVSRVHLKSVFSCKAGENGTTCFGRLNEALLKPLFLGNFTADQESKYRTIFDESASVDATMDLAVFAVVTTALRSPLFLFVRDLGGSDAAVATKLTNVESRSLLAISSSTILSAMQSMTQPAPDLSDELKRKSFLNDALNKPDGIKFLAKFYASLGYASAISSLKKDSKLFPDFTPSLQADMATQIQRTLERSLKEDGASAVELMKTRKFWMSPELAKLYDYKGTLPADGFAEVDSATRAGFWSMAGIQAVLAGGTDSLAMHRGKTFLSNALCQDLGAPPPGAGGEAANIPANTLREQFDAIAAKPSCGGCHANLNPFGLSMENYNAIGKVRTVYESNGKNVNTVILSNSIFIPVQNYKNASEIFETVATSPIYWQCIAKQAFTHATGLAPAGYDPLMRKVFDAFVTSGYSIRGLFIDILASETLQSRVQGM